MIFIVYQARGYVVLGLKQLHIKYRFLVDPSALLFPPQGPLADIKNVRNFSRAGLFISRFYPKARELRQFQNCDKIL